MSVVMSNSKADGECCEPTQRWFSSVYMRFSVEPKSNSWQARLEHILHQKWLHLLMAVLLIIDLVLIITGLELQILTEQAVLKQYRNCDQLYDAGLAVPLALDNPVNNPAGLPACAPDLTWAHTIHDIDIALGWCSVVILSIFFVENFLNFLTMGCAFFCDFFYMLDTLVVSTSIMFELVFLLGIASGAAVGGLLVLARTWRFARVAHGFYFLEHAEEKAHEKAEQSAKRMQTQPSGGSSFGQITAKV